MDQFNHDIFEQLLSDTDFIRWTKGKECEKPDYWANWKKQNPQYRLEFDEAKSSVLNFTFVSEKVSNQEIQYLWAKTEEQIASQGKVRSLQKYMITFSRIAAMLILPLLVYTMWLQVQHGKHDRHFAQNDLSQQKIVVTAPIGTRSFIDLPDGTQVWLNAGTKLTYPPAFGNDERRVKVEGEAYFIVSKNKEIPFLVENLGPAIKVYGTEFNVNSYSEDAEVTVALVEGKVALQLNNKEYFLKPGQISYFDKVHRAVTIKNESVEHVTCWREGKLLFRETPLCSILTVLQRRYNVDFVLNDPNLGNYKYNATFQDETLEQVLDLLQFSMPINYKYIKRNLEADASGIKGKVIIDADKDRFVKH